MTFNHGHPRRFPYGLLGASPNVRSYLRFDLSSLPANATIQQATLQVKAAESSDSWANG
ncbi:MAG: hypothetical protein KatS3mg050_1425 [Litorilinea sp.]|nr:MAG: hypothetical protein KatS3mg050_1425 [Litorilinea sp.]